MGLFHRVEYSGPQLNPGSSAYHQSEIIQGIQRLCIPSEAREYTHENQKQLKTGNGNVFKE